MIFVNYFLICFTASIFLSFNSQGSPLELTDEDSFDNQLPLAEIRDFVEIFNKIKADYIETLDDTALMQKAMQGMISELDPHSSFLDEEHYADLQENTSGQFGGIGVEIGLKHGDIIVIAPIDGSPAKKAGVRTGDIISKVDNSPVSGLGIENAVRRIKGTPGSKVKISVQREGHSKPLHFKINRALIDNKSVSVNWLAPSYLYIRISQFQISTGKELATKVTNILKASRDDVKGVILDLRDNPGGVLSGAVAVSNAFLKTGLIVSTKGRNQEADQEYSATTEVLIDDVPLVTLINEGSASASEIVAGALQDNHRSILAGRPSFGKGSVQTVYPMRNKTAIKLTTAWYYTPNNRIIQTTGIIPDIIIEKLNLERKDSAENVKEANLNRHLQNVNRTVSSPEFNFANLAKQDFELYEATKLLKAVVVARKNKIHSGVKSPSILPLTENRTEN